MRRFLSAAGDDSPSTYIEAQGAAPKIGATRADADRMLLRMRTRPNFEGYLRDSMYWAHLSAQLMDGVMRKDASNAKARTRLGWDPRSREDALVSSAESLLEMGLLS